MALTALMLFGLLHVSSGQAIWPVMLQRGLMFQRGYTLVNYVPFSITTTQKTTTIKEWGVHDRSTTPGPGTSPTIKEVVVIEDGKCRLVKALPPVVWKPCRQVMQCERLRRRSEGYCDPLAILSCPRDQPYCCSWDKKEKGVCKSLADVDEDLCQHPHMRLICCRNETCIDECLYGMRGPIGNKQWL